MNAYLKLEIFGFISFIIIGLLLFIFKKYIKNNKTKDIIFCIIAMLTVLIHYINFIYELIFLNYIEDPLPITLYLPAYPCNIIMWMNLVLAFIIIIKKNKGLFYNFLLDFVSIFGTIFAIVGIVINYNFLDNPDFKNLDILKGLLSHVTLLLNCLYVIVMNYSKKFNTLRICISGIAGYLLMIICGYYTAYICIIQGLSPRNPMFILYPPYENMPYINKYTIGIIAFVIIIIFGTLFEIIAYPKEERWYNKLNKTKKID